MHVDEKQKPNCSKDNNDVRVRNRVQELFLSPKKMVSSLQKILLKCGAAVDWNVIATLVFKL